jgi:hypothetical protein
MALITPKYLLSYVSLMKDRVIGPLMLLDHVSLMKDRVIGPLMLLDHVSKLLTIYGIASGPDQSVLI